VIPEAASRINALSAGDVHLATEVAPDEIAGVERQSALEVVGGAINNIRVLNYGTFGGPMQDPRIRRAMNLAIDRRAVAAQLLGGRVGVPNGYQWPAYGDMFIEDFAGPRYDPDAARRLLEEAGYAGQPIEYRTQVSYYAAELSTAEVIQQMWQAVGLNIDVKICENWSQVYAQPNYAVFNGSINMVYPDTMGALYVLYGPNGFIRFQAQSWRDDEFDKIGAMLATSIGRDERRQLHRRILELFDTIDPPGTVLHETGMLYGKRRDIPWSPQPTPFMDFGPFNPGTRKA
jgi:peptide/nickel transport system substrate-binding protein